MGRRVKGKKHHGVKNPHEQAARRETNVMSKRHNAPLNPNEQAAPKSLLRIMDFRKKVQEEGLKVKKVRNKRKKMKLMSTIDFVPKDHNLPSLIRPVQPTGVVTQLKGESDEDYLMRINEECSNALILANFENKFNTKLKVDPKTGLATNRDEEYSKIDNLNEKLISKQKLEERKLGKRKIIAAKREAKKEIKMEKKKEKDFNDFKDEIKFGEVVQEPPKFQIKPKLKAKLSSVDSKPGQKDLLLKRMFQNNTDVQISSSSLKKQPESLARKKMLEEERIRVVELYREMKQK